MAGIDDLKGKVVMVSVSLCAIALPDESGQISRPVESRQIVVLPAGTEVRIGGSIDETFVYIVCNGSSYAVAEDHLLKRIG